MAAISNLCDSVLIINEGQIFFNGKTNEGVQKYLVNIVDANVQRGIAKSISQIDLAELAVKGIRISQQGLNGLQFVYNKPIVIQFLFTIKERIIGFRIGFDILDNTNDLVVFRTFHDDLNVNIDYIEPGDYESIVEIPPCLLKEGTYTLSFLAGIHNVKWLSEGDIRISFSIVNTGGINQFYADHRPGVIMPQLNWNNK